MKQKLLTSLIDIARAHEGEEYHSQKGILNLFGYSPTTYLNDTKVAAHGLIEAIRENGLITGYRITGMVTLCFGVRQLGQLVRLPKQYWQYISDSIIQQVRENERGWRYNDDLPRVVA